MNKLICFCCHNELMNVQENIYYCEHCNITVEIKPDTADNLKDSKIMVTQGRKENTPIQETLNKEYQLQRLVFLLSKVKDQIAFVLSNLAKE